MSFLRKEGGRKVPGLNTTSTADISFMLLILFLVATSMDADKGLPRQLPPAKPRQEQQQPTETAERNVLRLAIKADGTLTANDKPLPLTELRQRVERFVDNPTASPSLPEKSVRNVRLIGRVAVSDRHVITLDISPDAPYDAYFHVQDDITQAYLALRSRLAADRFHRPYAQCTPQQRDAIRECYPQRVTETCPTNAEGGRP